jgi:dihydrofolate synthase/folylpolyglutamate synthase
LNAALADSLKRIETLIIRPAESFADPEQRLAEFTQRLERTRRLMSYLGNPHFSFKSIHVGGTSGKGSVAIMCESILRAARFHVGTHTSPYLQTPLEKVRVEGRLMAAEQAIALSDRIMQAVYQVRDRHPKLGAPQYAEAWVAMALRHFADRQVEVGVIEVGMGGRYDATNILLPEVSVINTVHYDHIRVLGETLGEIAYHKAGIIKTGVPAVIGNLPPEALVVIEEEGARQGARLVRLNHEFHCLPSRLSRGGGTFSYRGINLEMGEIEIGMIGEHQLENAATALAALEVFADTQGFQLEEDAVRRGLAGARFAGRIEVMQQQPKVVLDGAHNEEKIEALVKALPTVFTYDRLILVLGMLETKNAEPIVRMLASIADQVITTEPDVKGKPAIPEDELARIARRVGAKHVRAGGAPLEALRKALTDARPGDLVVVTGSLYLIGEVRSHWHEESDIVDHRTMFPSR